MSDDLEFDLPEQPIFEETFLDKIVNNVDNLTNEYGVMRIIIIISLAYIIANIISIFNINFNFSKQFY